MSNRCSTDIFPGMAAAAVIAQVEDERFTPPGTHGDVFVPEAPEGRVLLAPRLGVLWVDLDHPPVFLANEAELGPTRPRDILGLAAVRQYGLLNADEERGTALEVLFGRQDRTPRGPGARAIERGADDAITEAVGINALEHVGRRRAGPDQKVAAPLLMRTGTPGGHRLIGVGRRTVGVDGKPRKPMNAAIVGIARHHLITSAFATETGAA